MSTKDGKVPLLGRLKRIRKQSTSNHYIFIIPIKTPGSRKHKDEV